MCEKEEKGGKGRRGKKRENQKRVLGGNSNRNTRKGRTEIEDNKQSVSETKREKGSSSGTGSQACLYFAEYLYTYKSYVCS